MLAFFTENKENEHLFFREFHGRQHREKDRNHSINSKTIYIFYEYV